MIFLEQTPLSIEFVILGCGCGLPPHLLRGYVSANGILPGDKAKYRCAYGYDLEGTDELTCDANGT